MAERSIHIGKWLYMFEPLEIVLPGRKAFPGQLFHLIETVGGPAATILSDIRLA